VTVACATAVRTVAGPRPAVTDPRGTMATYRIHVRSDEFQYENEVHATRVDKEDGWTVFWADKDVYMRIRDEHIVSLEHLV
jgi:hypothetical protein